MKKLLVALALVAVVNIALAADYTPQTTEGGVSVIALTPTAAAELAIVGGQAQLTAAAASTNTLASPAAIGVEVTIVNVGANAVTITETGIEGAGAMTLGQYDVLRLVSIDTSTWVETGRSNN